MTPDDNKLLQRKPDTKKGKEERRSKNDEQEAARRWRRLSTASGYGNCQVVAPRGSSSSRLRRRGGAEGEGEGGTFKHSARVLNVKPD